MMIVYKKKIYIKFLNKINQLKIDCVGLSFIQNSNVIKCLKKKFPNFLYVSKLENLLGHKNRKNIIAQSDAIMIDRGDLAAEVGVTKFLSYTNDIIHDAKLLAKPTIIATENLNSLITGSTPSKSDVLNIDYYLKKSVDFIMLSDETATSNNWQNTLDWLRKFLSYKVKRKNINALSILQIVKNLKNETIIVFSKKGHFFNKIDFSNHEKIILFTENIKISKLSKLKTNVTSNYIKYPKKNLDNFIYTNIKKNMRDIFKFSNYAYLVNVRFPRKNSRANSLSIIEKKDFLTTNAKY